jgi:hypothetical protein
VAFGQVVSDRLMSGLSQPKKKTKSSEKEKTCSAEKGIRNKLIINRLQQISRAAEE